MAHSDHKTPSRFKFDQWIFEPSKSILSNKKKSQKLPKLVNDLLVLFIQKPTSVLSRDYLINQLWADKVVNEEALSRLMAELRKTLGDSAKDPKYIRTLPKKGYEFIYNVEPINNFGLSNQHLKFIFVILTIFISIGLIRLDEK